MLNLVFLLGTVLVAPILILLFLTRLFLDWVYNWVYPVVKKEPERWTRERLDAFDAQLKAQTQAGMQKIKEDHAKWLKREATKRYVTEETQPGIYVVHTVYDD